ncbi:MULTISPECIES: tyrosine-protein phosphatase [unclassified Streptomyces]|uniref:tyrosine-protein phosphatase n=1 Tax=unclassified Streptomyces TaxID=2593676 RepID=UPI00166099B8|nr:MULTISPECIES: tyrosine-protein phosphatase [unclassified Streptomyces]MBD0711608.1 protein tyrosine phosphatase [Streptomyces sp. CBMA291]MBD0714805.1 protein tyrosine phosphatase [Streptomyces sp. CBMA370]
MSAIPATSVANLRDLGGLPLASGRAVRHGLVLRSGQLDRLDPVEPAVAGLGVRTVVDFRTESERTARPDRLPAGARALVADVLADRLSVSGLPPAARLRTLLSDPALAEEELGGGRVRAAFARTYRTFVSGAAARVAYRSFLTELGSPDAGPVLFHCSAGKDRTGWATVVVLSLLGADEETTRTEYLAVNTAVRQAYAPMIEGFTAQGGDPQLALDLIGVLPEYLEAALDEVAVRHGSMEAYVREGLGVPETVTELIRERLTVTGA